MKANPEEHCEDCIHWEPESKQYNPRCKLLSVLREKSNETCDKFEPNQLARIARGVASLAWNVEELGNLLASRPQGLKVPVVTEEEEDDDWVETNDQPSEWITFKKNSWSFSVPRYGEPMLTIYERMSDALSKAVFAESLGSRSMDDTERTSRALTLADAFIFKQEEEA